MFNLVALRGQEGREGRVPLEDDAIKCLKE